MQPHEADMQGEGCTVIDVSFDVPAGGMADRGLRAIMDDDERAWAGYSRSGVWHAAVLEKFEEHVVDFNHYHCSWYLPSEEENDVEYKTDQVWEALNAAYDQTREHYGVDVTCVFRTKSEPKLVLPVTLFNLSAFPFNQIQGYRAARVEDDRTLWTATIDRMVSQDGYRIAITLDGNMIDSTVSLYRQCLDIRDQLTVRA